jgi:arylsulfatase A-like enzyme
MLHHKAPHRNWEPDERNKALLASRLFPEPPTFWDDYLTRPTALPQNRQTVARDLTRRDLKMAPPAELQATARQRWLDTVPEEATVDGRALTGDELTRWKYQRYMQDYLACVQGVDDSVGRVLDYLDEAGLTDNTIVFYTSDNGWYLGELGLYDKRFMYEPGMRVPLLVRGSGVKAGHVPRELVANIDLAPTFLDLAGLEIPRSMQGRSLSPLLRGESPADWRKSVYYRYYHDPGHHNTRAHFGVRTATHKLLYYWTKSAYEMYDLERDPVEQHNLLFDATEASEPSVARRFTQLTGELAQLQLLFEDFGAYADSSAWPTGSVDGPFPDRTELGIMAAYDAIALLDESEQ